MSSPRGVNLVLAGLLATSVAAAVPIKAAATPTADQLPVSAHCPPTTVRLAAPPQAGATASPAPRALRSDAGPDSYSALFTPQRMIPGEEYSVDVTVTNTSGTNRPKSDYVLSYRWTLPDGTDYTKPDNRAETVLPQDLAPGQSVTVQATVKAPVRTDLGTQRESFVLNWDLLNYRTGKWLSASDGVAPLSQRVTTEDPTSDQLGLEKFYEYSGTRAGPGWSAVVNEFSGNAVVGYDLLSNPSRGLGTFVRLTSNSMDSSDSYVGPGWSLSTSTLTRLGSPLQFHNSLLGDPDHPAGVTMIDGDGTTHLFKLDKHGSPDKTRWTYDSPAGVHLFLQRASGDQVWTMTRPDGIQLSFDEAGYQTAITDRNGNELRFHYERTNWGNRNTGVLTDITDAAGRRVLTLDYYARGDDYSWFAGNTRISGQNLVNTAIVHQLRSITDLSGRKIVFTYGDDGLLRELADGADTHVQKVFSFFYEGSRLVRINDALGHGTKLVYAQNRVRQLIDRSDGVRAFEYTDTDGDKGTAISTKITDPNGHTSTALFDGFGRPVRLTSSRHESTELAWDDDNNVRVLKEPNGAILTWLYDTKTGYPLESRDAEANLHGRPPTKFGYLTRLDGHVADLGEKTSPEGRKWSFGRDDRGNLKTLTDPRGAVTRNDYDTAGQLTTTTDANGHVTKFEDYDPSGSPRRLVNALDCVTAVQYDVAGNVVSTMDAKQKTSTFTYDVFKRPLTSKVPKEATKNDYITTLGPTYDQNDNVLSSTAPNGAVTTAAYDANDRMVATTLPKDDPKDTVVKQSTFEYDRVGNLTKQTRPKGDATRYSYDENNQLVATTDAIGNRSTFEYDSVGNVVRVVDPRNTARKYGYDLNQQITKVIDAAGFETGRRYDRDGLVVGKTDEEGNETLAAYDERGSVREVKVPYTKATDGAIVYRTTQYAYDPAGNRTKTITPRGVETADDPDDFVQETVYDELNRVLAQSAPFDKDDERIRTPDRTFFSYDEVGRLTEVSTPPSNGQTVRNVTRTTYFDNGWIRGSVDPWDIRTTFDYDELGNQTSRTVDSVGKAPARTMTWEYYPDGKLKARGDDGVPVGKETVVVDNSDPVVEVAGEWGTAGPSAGHEGVDYRVHPAGTGTDHLTWGIDVPRSGTYEVFVRYTGAATATDATYTVEHDGGVASKTVDQTQLQGDWVSLGSFPYTEDAIKKITLSDNADGTVVADAVKLVRDNSGEVDNEQKKFGYAYDGNDNLTLMTDRSPGAAIDSYVIGYTPLNQVAEVQEKLGDVLKKKTAYTYDASGNPLTRTHDAQSAVYEYNESRNLLTKVTNTDAGGSPQVTTYGYDRRRLRSLETKANGNVVSYDEYYLDGRSRHEIERKPDGTVANEHRLEYDADGQLAKDSSRTMNADDTSAYLEQTRAYAYDPRDRIRKVTKSSGTPESYVHDANSNVIEQTLDGKAATFTYDRNRLVTSKTGQATSAYVYDPYGRLDKVTAAGKLVEKYRYDGFDHLIELQKPMTGNESARVTIRNTYDPIDRTTTRTEADKRTDFTYLGLSYDVLGEALNGKPQKSYQYSPTGERLSQTKYNDDGSTENGIYGYNAHSDVEQLTDDKGNAKATYGYTAYGDDDRAAFTGVDKPAPQQPVKDPYNAYRFNAKRFDPVSGNYDMGFRDYSPGRNTFLSRDTYGGALSDLQLTMDPWSGNRYAFGGGNPVSRVELDGHRNCGIDGVDCGMDRKIHAFLNSPVVPIDQRPDPNHQTLPGGTTFDRDEPDKVYINNQLLPPASQFGGPDQRLLADKVDDRISHSKLYRDMMQNNPRRATFMALSDICVDDPGYCGTNFQLAVTANMAFEGELENPFGGMPVRGKAGVPREEGGRGPGSAGVRRAKGGCPLPGNSFAGDTQVLMADGSHKPISEVKQGDKVLATDPETGRTEGKAVVAVILGEGSKNLVRLTIDTDGPAGGRTGDVTATSGHRFWVDDQGRWVEARDLVAGEDVRTPEGARRPVVAALSYTAIQPVYNLSVDGIHTYYVLAGDTPVLAHNTGPCTGDEEGIDHAKSRHLKDGPEWDKNAGYFDPGTDFVELARGSAGRIGTYQKDEGTIIYVINAGRIIGYDKGQATNFYTVIRDLGGGELVTMFPGKG
ncbi:polymorphic toxin-type HINT domain-containing protein [Amycolatopsis sp. cmx-4-68]|uniref:golvesin C-terminal-like domain-containing protein n=1 Tax=Amycolatopsis sp. cmx-4-68 TaxID=2790938 RepID=UPI00397DB0A8